jgi:hypothetical protein
MQERLIDILDWYAINFVAIQGSCDDVDKIEIEQEKLLNQAISQILTFIKEEMPKKIDFAFNNESKAPNNEEFVKGWNDYHDEMLKKMEGGGKNE